MPSPIDSNHPAAPSSDTVRLDDQRAAGIFAAAERQDGWGRDEFGYYTWVEHDDGHTYQIDVHTHQVAGCPDVQVTVAVITYRLHPDRDEPIGAYAAADTSRTLQQTAEAAWCAQTSQPT
jgi:hypothetical protein